MRLKTLVNLLAATFVALSPSNLSASPHFAVTLSVDSLLGTSSVANASDFSTQTVTGDNSIPWLGDIGFAQSGGPLPFRPQAVYEVPSGVVVWSVAQTKSLVLVVAGHELLALNSDGTTAWSRTLPAVGIWMVRELSGRIAVVLKEHSTTQDGQERFRHDPGLLLFSADGALERSLEWPLHPGV